MQKKTKLLQIRVDDDFMGKVDRLQSIYQCKTVSDTIRIAVETENKLEPRVHIPLDGADAWKKSRDYWQGLSDGLIGAEYNNNVLKSETEKAYKKGYADGKNGR